ncbi:DUF1542 domain-containing protein, partial [Lactobacillus gallinarum]|uniref:DUF1542 domain-containing protein n=1 Tax=Lactobacillus gallinarum TaxID=52242 RepID=UPI0024B9C7DA
IETAIKGLSGKETDKTALTAAISKGKAAAKDAIAQAAKTKDDAIDASNLTAEEKDALKKTVAGEVQTAKGNIDAATKDADVKTAQTNGEKAINAVEIPTSSKTKNDANSDLKNTADAAKKAIDETSGLTADQKQTAKDQIDTAVGDAQENIKKASNNQGVADAKAAGKLAIDKVSAKAAIDGAAKAKNDAIDNTNGLTDSEKKAAKSQVATDAKAAKEAIDQADSNAAVTNAVNNGTVAINKDAANAAIDGALAEKNNLIDAAPNLTVEEKQAVKEQANKAADNAKSAINTAQDNDAVKKAQTDGVNNINGITVPTDSDVKKNANSDLDKTAAAAKKAIDETSGLTADQKKTAKKQIDTAVGDAQENIKKASNNQGVADATDAGKLAIDKVSANAAIDGALAEKNNSIDTAPNLTDEEKKAVKGQAKTAADSAKTAISNAKTVTDVESAKNTGVENIKNMPIPTASKTKNDANSALDTTADAAKKAIDKTSGLTADQKQAAKDQIDQAVTAAQGKIKNASDNKGVADATAAGKLAIDKVSAKAAIDDALNTKKSEINGATNLDQPTKDKL